MKKVSSGLVYYYDSSPDRTGVITILIEMNEMVRIDLFERAIQQALEVHREFKKKIVRNGNNIYYETNEKPVRILPVHLDVTLIKDTNDYLFGFAVEQRDIYFSVFHLLTDGKGIFSFIKTVLYYYVHNYHSDDSMIENEIAEQIQKYGPENQFFDVYEKILEEEERNRKTVLSEGTFCQLGNETEKEKFMVITLEHSALEKIANRWSVRSYAVISVLLGNMIRENMKNQVEQIAAYMPVDTRRNWNADRSPYQCLSYMNVPCVEVKTGETFGQQCKRYQTVVWEKLKSDDVQNRVYEDANIIKLLQREKLSIDAKKRMIYNLFQKTAVHRGSFGMSVLPFLEEKEPLTKYVEDFIICIPSGGMGIFCEMIQVGKKINLNIRYRESMENIVLQAAKKIDEVLCPDEVRRYDVPQYGIELP